MGSRSRLAIACLSVFLSACAARTGFYGPLDPLAELYARNEVVCVPTGIGNLAGAPGYLLMFPIALLLADPNPGSAPREHGMGELAYAAGFGVLALLPASIAGFALGTPFLPFSYLAPEDVCHPPIAG